MRLLDGIRILGPDDATAVMESIYRISDQKMGTVDTGQTITSSDVVKDLVRCGYLKSADIADRFGGTPLDPGEDPLEGALRELEEETGIRRDLVEILARCPRELTYDLPEDLIGKVWKKRWRGQRQTWFLARFTGSTSLESSSCWRRRTTTSSLTRPAHSTSSWRRRSSRRTSSFS